MAISLLALVHILCRVVSGAVKFLKTAVAMLASEFSQSVYTYFTIVLHVLRKYQLWSWS